MSEEQIEQTISLEELQQLTPEAAADEVLKGQLDARLEEMYRALLAKFPKFAYGNKQGQTYIDARSVMERLDQVFGWQNWWATCEMVDERTCAMQVDIHVLLPDGRELIKGDIGYPNNEAVDGKNLPNANGKIVGSGQPLKDAFSDGLKRAGVHFGIARHLYPYPGAKNMDRADVQEKAAAAAAKKAEQQQPAETKPAPAEPKQVESKSNGTLSFGQIYKLAQGVAQTTGEEAKDVIKKVMDEKKIKVANSADLTPAQLKVLAKGLQDYTPKQAA